MITRVERLDELDTKVKLNLFLDRFIPVSDKTLPRTIITTTIMLLMFFGCKKIVGVICVNKHLIPPS